MEHLSIWMMIFVFLGGAIGTLIRDLVNTIVREMHKGDLPIYPWATLFVNLTGCFLIGLFAGWLTEPALQMFWMTGVCGGLTTFSTLQWESWRLWQNGLRNLVWQTLVIHYGIGLAATAYGWWLAT